MSRVQDVDILMIRAVEMFYNNLYYYNSIVVCLCVCVFVCPDCIKEMEE